MPSSRMFLAWCIFALPLASSLTPPLRSVGHRTTAGARFRLHAVDNENLEEKFDKLKEAQRLAQEEKDALREGVFAAKRLNTAMYAPTAEDKAQVQEKFREESYTLIGDSVFLSLLGICFAWGVGSMTTALSYAVGAAIGTGYVILLSQYAASFGDPSGGGGASQGRFALVFFLILLGGKNKEILDILPMLFGFFTYQISAFVQGLKSLNASE